MAEGWARWNAVENSLKCSICKGTFATPRALACLHTFCEGCIQSVISDSKRNSGHGSNVWCPDCSQVTDLSAYENHGTPQDELAKKLPLNFTIKNIIDGMQAAAIDGLEEGFIFISSLDDFRVLENCSEHAQEKLEFYCSKHQAVLCKQCKKKHRMCFKTTIETAARKTDESGEIQEEIQALETELEAAAATLTRNVADLTTQIDDIPATMQALEEQILAHVAKVCAAYKGQIMEELKENATRIQKRKIEGCVSWLKVLDTMREDLRLVASHGTDVQRFIAGNQLKDQLKNFREVCRNVTDSVQCVELRLGLQDILKSVLAISVGELGIETRIYTPDKPEN